MTRRRGGSVEESLIELTSESTRLASRLSWKGAVALGFALLLIVGVAIPYALEWWSESHTRAIQQTQAGRILGDGLHQVLLLRAIFPMKVIGSIAAILCWLIAAWKLLKELRNTH